MRRYSRALGGLLAKRNGQSFETKIERQCTREGLTFVPIPPGCKSIGANRLIRVTSPFDCIIGHNEKVAFLDLKTTNENKISMADSIVKPHQKQALSALSNHQMAGLLVQFHAHDRVVYFQASQLYGKPLGPEDGQAVGTLTDLSLRSLFYSR